MYFLFLLILFGIAYIVYASKVSSDERLEELRNKKENLKREKEKCEAELKDLKEMNDVISTIHDSLIEKKLTAQEVSDLNKEYNDKIETFAKSIGKNRMFFNWFYKEIGHLLKIENVEFADEVDEAQKHFNATLEGIGGESSVLSELFNYENELEILHSINLPYEYLGSNTKDNQIDSIVISNRGIFILEVKNYYPDKMQNALTITYEINDQGYFELNSVDEMGKRKKTIYNSGNGIRKQMELHRQALAGILKKHNKSNYIDYIHSVCVIAESSFYSEIDGTKFKTIGKNIITEDKLYSEVLTDPNFPVCLSYDEIKELEQIINSENQEERKYTYTIMKDIPDNVMEYMLNYNSHFHPHHRSEEELTDRINNIESETKRIEEKLSQS